MAVRKKVEKKAPTTSTKPSTKRKEVTPFYIPPEQVLKDMNCLASWLMQEHKGSETAELKYKVPDWVNYKHPKLIIETPTLDKKEKEAEAVLKEIKAKDVVGSIEKHLHNYPDLVAWLQIPEEERPMEEGFARVPFELEGLTIDMLIEELSFIYQLEMN